MLPSPPSSCSLHSLHFTSRLHSGCTLLALCLRRQLHDVWHDGIEGYRGISRDIEGYRGIGARPYPYREGHRGRGTSGTSGTCSLHRVEINTHLLRQATDLHGKECGNKFPSKDVDKVGTSDVHRDIRHQTDDLVFKFRPKSCRIPILALLAHLALLISHLSTNQSQPESKNVENHCSMRELYTPVFGMLVSGHSHAVWKYPVFKYSNIQASTSCQLPHVSKCFKCPNTFYFYFFKMNQTAPWVLPGHQVPVRRIRSQRKS